MRIFVLSFLTALLAGGLHLNQAETEPGKQAIASARQLIVVTTNDWNAVEGELRRFERSSETQPWRAIGGKIPIVVGRNGMAWGRGLHGDASPIGGDGPIKKEGDGRSPAGVFRLSAAFGYQARAAAVKLPYLHASSTLECVDDSRSAHYNQVLDRRSIKQPDWNSSEQMRRDDEQYRLGVIVDHNAKREPERGSCIFLHIWAGSGKGTAGCTAMSPQSTQALLRWLDAKKNPMLAQLPRIEFERLQRAWRLPN